jgi:protein-L-isoaspartate(D-aspartate) O-methyltransferase
MIDFDQAREHMVNNQLRTSGIFDPRLLSRMRSIPRELFVADARRPLAYVDEVQWFGSRGASRFMSPPVTLARLIKLADLSGSERVLLVGAATGYATAVVAGVAESVVGLEPDAALAQQAVTNLRTLGISNAEIIAGDVSALSDQRFDAVIVDGALTHVSAELLNLVSPSGRLVAIVQDGGVSVSRYVSASGAVRDDFHATLPQLFSSKPVEHFVF